MSKKKPQQITITNTPPAGWKGQTKYETRLEESAVSGDYIWLTFDKGKLSVMPGSFGVTQLSPSKIVEFRDLLTQLIDHLRNEGVDL